MNSVDGEEIRSCRGVHQNHQNGVGSSIRGFVGGLVLIWFHKTMVDMSAWASGNFLKGLGSGYDHGRSHTASLNPEVFSFYSLKDLFWGCC